MKRGSRHAQTYRQDGLERPVFVNVGAVLEPHVQLDERWHCLFRQSNVCDLLARGYRRRRRGRPGDGRELKSCEECERAEFGKISHDQRRHPSLAEVDSLDNVNDRRLSHRMNMSTDITPRSLTCTGVSASTSGL